MYARLNSYLYFMGSVGFNFQNLIFALIERIVGLINFNRRELSQIKFLWALQAHAPGGLLSPVFKKYFLFSIIN